MSEMWKDIPGWKGLYQASNLGRVKSLARRVPGRPGVMLSVPVKILKPWLSNDGYPGVALCRDNKRSMQQVHRLVLLTFVGRPHEGMEACHNDGDKLNNIPTNLRWDTRSANTFDKVAHGAHLYANRTHCPAGHPYDEANTYNRPSGGRQCRKCRCLQKARRRVAIRLQAVAS